MGRRVYPLMRRLELSLEPECRVLIGLPDAGKDKKKSPLCWLKVKKEKVACGTSVRVSVRLKKSSH